MQLLISVPLTNDSQRVGQHSSSGSQDQSKSNVHISVHFIQEVTNGVVDTLACVRGTQ